MKRRVLWIVGGLALIALILIFWPRDPNALPGADWRTFKSRFLDQSGRVVDTGNGNISHSEGQGYGMLLAVAFRDRGSFDRMWAWTQEHLQRPDDHLFSWRYRPEDGGIVDDPNNASDGDLLIAWALTRAARTWDDFEYQRAAALIVKDFFELTLADSPIGLQLLPGLVGFQSERGLMLNPSYYVFPALNELRATYPRERWADLDAGGRRFLELARFGEWLLNPNWALVGSLAIEIAPDKEPLFGYDAIRVPLHVAWEDPKSPLLIPYANFWESQPEGEPLPATVNLTDGELGPHPMLPGMDAIARLTMASVRDEAFTVRDVPLVDDKEPYYSASLKLLTKLAIYDHARALEGSGQGLGPVDRPAEAANSTVELPAEVEPPPPTDGA